ncbi:MAG: ribonuclease PH [Candidatus Thermoplasmatota archaeon]|nr:ribonuclease PH [Candidatus Thermoplasmatota archaeon]
MAKVKSGMGSSDRKKDELREVGIKLDFTPNALASLLYSQGDTQVLVCVTRAPSLPRWFPRDSDRGWVHAEYSLLPGSTDTRFRRERGGAKGRTMEIERLVARSLRGAVDLEELGPIALTVDCDILNADGGTRCASITAASIGLRIAIRRLISSGDGLPTDTRLTREDIRKGASKPEMSREERESHEISVMPMDVAALSVGVVDGMVMTDLDYVLDSNADVDMNVVMTSSGDFVEVQGTGEEATYTREELDSLIEAAMAGISQLHEIQAGILSDAS